MKVKVGISARHVHVTNSDVEILFGKGYELNREKDLSQPGQYACEERVTIVGPRSEIQRVRILGPERSQTQVEISKTDARALGIDAPVRLSGNLEGAGEVTIIGPVGTITKNAAIISARHIHVTKQEAISLGIYGKDKVSFKVNSKRGGIMDDVYVRVDENFRCEIHVDTDEGNAFLLEPGQEVELIEKD